MQLKETFYFVGKCLALRHCPENAEEIKNTLQKGAISFEKLVWVSSSQMVMSTLYVLLRDAGLLREFPDDLVDHMEQIHRMNCTRNELLTEQIEKTIPLLNKGGIQPIFLKGTAHLLEGLYKDIGERMIGDIDILLPFDEIDTAVQLLREQGYSNSYGMGPEALKKLRHFPRLISEKRVAAIEIHHELVHEPYRQKFNFEVINKAKERIPGKGDIYMPSHAHQVVFNIMHAQMNDSGFSARKLFLRQIYDLLLLSKKTDTLQSIKQVGGYPRHLNSNIALAASMLHHPKTLTFHNNFLARNYTRQTIFFLDHPTLHRYFRMRAYIRSRFSRYYRAVIKAFSSKTERKELMKKIVTRSWLKQHFGSYRQVWSA
jgi:hypothetical protein